MTIECYNVACRYHSCYTMLDEGPFCYEAECRLESDNVLDLSGRTDTVGIPIQVYSRTSRYPIDRNE
jgi:hypothetical protein